MFSFNSPHGACPACHGLGSTPRDRPRADRARRERLDRQGGAAPVWPALARLDSSRSSSRSPQTFSVDTETPWAELPAEQRDLFVHGTRRAPHPAELPQLRGARASRTPPRFPGLVPTPAAALRSETESELVRQKIEEYMSDRVCAECQRRPAASREPGGHRRRAQHPRVHRHERAHGARVPRRALADRHRAAHRRARHQGDPRAPPLPQRRRPRLPRRSTAPPRRSPAARRSASAWPRRSARRSSACSTSSTSPPSACTSATTTA